MKPNSSLIGLLTTLLLLTSSVLASPQHGKAKGKGNPPPIPITSPSEEPPTHYGILLIRAFQPLDIYGPLDTLQLLAVSPPSPFFPLPHPPN